MRITGNNILPGEMGDILIPLSKRTYAVTNISLWRRHRRLIQLCNCSFCINDLTILVMKHSFTFS